MICNYSLYDFCAATKRFKKDLRAVLVWDLNFILRSEIFVHWDGQLWASHLILGLEPVYSTWQAFGQALLVDSPLLSYIDVRHANFLPPRLTVGEVRDLSPYYTCLDELAPIRDESAERVSRHHRELAHQQVEQGNPPRVELEALAQEEEAAAESVHSSGVESKMVTRRVMSISRFVPGAQTSEQQQPPLAQAQSPPLLPPPPSCHRKRPRTVKQTQPGSGDALARTPPRQSRGIMIWEPTPAAQNVASSS